MKKGIVKWFNQQKGYGFILSEDKDYFVHFRSIKGGRTALKEGEHVSFVVAPGTKGEQASQVLVIEPDGNSAG